MIETPAIDNWYAVLEQGAARGWSRVQLADLIAKYGYVFTPTPFSASGCVPRRPRNCYGNAADLALHREDLTYCEGYAVRGEITRVPVEHAWCVTDDGHVVDTTWHDDDVTGWEYRGIPFTRSAVLEIIMDKLTYGLLEGSIVHDDRFDPEWIPERWRR